MKPCLVIPAYQPTTHLIDLVDQLLRAEFPYIVVVNDGSSPQCGETFQAIKRREGVILLEHAVNLGKGDALKTAFNYILTSQMPCSGVVTLDADGQHLINDVVNIANSFQSQPNRFYLGVRSFGSTVPFRSKFGNYITSLIFGFFVGRKISDTQTGLRGIPLSLLPKLLRLRTTRYEFELDMIILACRERLQIAEIPIETVYFGENENSHFNPLMDSLRIYFVLLRFSFLSLATEALDTFVFFISYHLTGYIFLSTVISRTLAGAFNFSIAKKVVFKSTGNVVREGIRYASLVIILMGISYGLLTSLVKFLNFDVYLAKIFSETLLFLLSFASQQIFIFNSKPDSDIESPDAYSKVTNWNAYYRSPTKSALITRKITTHNLIKCFKIYGKKSSNGSIIEFGGANSCFFNAIQSQIRPSSYTIVDNNQLGLDKFKENFPKAKNYKLIKADILENFLSLEKAEICFSVGLIEHFDRDGTKKAIRTHFESTKPGGLVVMTFPTPTWLYRATRSIAEFLGVWKFPDERPLKMAEVINEVQKYGSVLHSSINWPIILTQGIVVIRTEEG